MKRKILFILMLSVMLGMPFISTNAEEVKAEVGDVVKPLVCVQGENYNSYLEYAGYQIVYNNVNFATSGNYYVIYENTQTKHQYLKEVEVVEKETLSSTGYCQITQNNLFLDSNLSEVYRTNLLMGDNNYLIHNLINPDNQEEGASVYLSCFYKNSLKWQKLISVNSKVLISDILSDGVNLYLVGYLVDTTVDIYLAIYNFDGKLLTEETIYGNKTESNLSALLWGEHLYLTGTTTSTDSYFKGTRKSEDSFIAKIDKNSLLLKDIYLFNGDGIDYISDFLVFNEKLFLSYSYLDDNFRINQLVIMDDKLNILETTELCLQTAYKTIKMVCDSAYLYLLSSYYSTAYSKTIARIYVYDENLKVIKKEDLEYAGYNAKPIDIVINDQQTLSVLLEMTDESLKTGFALIKYHFLEKVLEIVKLNNARPAGFHNDDGTCFYLETHSKLSQMAINVIKVKKFGPALLTESVNNYQVEINFKKAYCQKNLSNLTYNPLKFGEYRLRYGFENEQLIFLYHLDTYLPENINVRENEVYDLGYILKFNGEGYLNGERVYSNTKILTEGDYLLEVVGMNNYKKQVAFKVRDYQVLESYYESGVVVNELTGSSSPLTFPDIEVYTGEIQPSSTTLQNSWLIIFPLITIFSCSIFIIRFR